MPFTPEEQARILLAEHSSLRSETVAKTGHGLQVAGFVVTALSFLVAQSRELFTLPVFYAILVLIIGAAFLTLIPNPIDQNPWAHWRSPMDMMRQGWSTSLFHAAQQWSTRSS